MGQKNHFNNLENQVFTNYEQIGTTAKFSLILIFGMILLLSAAETARAATFTVDRTDDASVSACTNAPNDCTLRGAIAAANASAADDDIRFLSSITNIALSNGELVINNNGILSLDGSNPTQIIIDGQYQSRIFSIEANAIAAINNMEVRRGQNNSFSFGGGAILNLGTLTLNNCRITSSRTFSSPGGGIYNNGTLNINNSSIDNNQAGLSTGGGIFNNNSPGVLNISNSTIDSNIAQNSAGGISDNGGTIHISSSTISNNQSGDAVGGISNNGTFTLINSTVSNNLATQNGAGGISNSNTGTFNLISSSVIRNISGSTIAVGAGVNNCCSGTFNAKNSIIADNGDGFRFSDTSGTLNSQGYNLIEDARNTTIVGNTTGNILGQDPLLDPAGLKNNGGATQTVALLRGSPAIDAADPNDFPIRDQRGIVRPIDGDNNGSALPDIGAYEVAGTLIVTKTADTNDGVCDADCSLREAISVANSLPADDIIEFDAAVFSTAQTITLSGSVLNIENNGRLAINGTGANLLTVSGNNLSQVFRIGGAIVTIDGLKVTAGNELFGGGIGNYGTLTINNSIVSNCQSNDGGGIYSTGFLHILNSTITGNTVTGSGGGGGIRKESGFLNVLSSTVSHNTASAGGGILSVAGNTNIENSGISNNTSTDTGGGIRADSGSLSINLSNILSNTAVSEGGGIRNNAALTIGKSTIEGNMSGGGGGGILNVGLGQLTITFSTIKNNRSEDSGGGLLQLGQGTIQFSTISNNSAADGGGGIFNSGSNSLNLEQSTVFGNSATDGGGIANVGTLQLKNVTIASNQAVSGAGIINIPGTINALNTLIADNMTEDVFGTINSQGYNLIENPKRAVITGNFTGVITGIDPLLDPSGLRDNGGATKTVSLLPGSIAIDKGGFIVGNDQRFFSRPVDFANIPNAVGGNGSDIGAFERQFNEIIRRTPFDFDGDGKADIAVFRPSNGVWYVQQSTAGFKAATWGFGTDTLVPGDYDGDGKTDIAVFRKSDNSTWYILQSSDNTFRAVQFGATNQQQQLLLFDTPVPADYDGDGKTDIAVFTRTDNLGVPTTFNVLKSSDNTSYSVQWGQAFDTPIPADYDGDGKADVAVNRGGIWYILNSGNNQFRAVQFGTAQDKLVPADYDGDGKDDIAVYRESNGSWYYLQSGNGDGFVGVQFGASEDKPVPADYDGDGKTDIAVFRPSNGAWYRLNSSNGSFSGQLFGFGTDKPIPNAFVR